MPKLNQSQVGAVAAAQAASGGFLLPAGRYAAQLSGVEEKQGQGQYPYWSWAFENLHDESGVRHPGRQWNNTSLSPKSYGFLKASFEAFKVEPGTDTDDLIGSWVVLYLDQEPIAIGPKAGDLRNAITSVTQFSEKDWPFDTNEFAKGSSASDDEF